MLWVALHLPLLSLESFAATLPPAVGEPALALMGSQRIVSANAAVHPVEEAVDLVRRPSQLLPACGDGGAVELRFALCD